MRVAAFAIAAILGLGCISTATSFEIKETSREQVQGNLTKTVTEVL